MESGSQGSIHLTAYPIMLANFFWSSYFIAFSQMNGCFNNYFAFSLYFGFFFKQQSRKLSKLPEKPLTLGGYSVTILYIALRGCRYKYGGWPSHNSTMTIPSDQISTISSYYYFFTSSGAIHAVVPANPSVFNLSEVSCKAYPKSAILTFPYWFNNTLSLLISLWIWFFMWMEHKPFTMFLTIIAIIDSGIFFLWYLMKFVRDPPFIY